MARDKRRTAVRSQPEIQQGGTLKSLLRDAAAKAQAGDHASAETLFRRYLDQDHASAAAWSGLATARKRQANFHGAATAYDKALGLDPTSASIHIGLAETLLFQGLLPEALARCQAGLRYEKRIGEGHIIRAYIYKARGAFAEAADDLRRVLKVHPHSVPVHALLSEILVQAGCLDEASTTIGRAIVLAPHNLAIREHQADILMKLNRAGEAIKTWEAAIAANSGSAEAHRALASLYKDQGRSREAFDTYQKAVDLDPKSTRTYLELAKLMMGEYQIPLAESLFRMIVLLNPENANFHYNLGMCLNRQEKAEEAATCLRKAIALKPDHIWALADLCYLRQKSCDWPGLRQQQQSASRLDSEPLSPFLVLSYIGTTPQKELAIARHWSNRYKTIEQLPRVSSPGIVVASAARRIRVGYVSSDFHNHATVMLMIGLLEKHDRTRFEILAYSFSPDDQTILRQRMIDSVDVFLDVRNLSIRDIARRIQDDRIDILIDLKGYTQDSRTEIFAMRPAPIQVNYLGYPGTMGADFIDYIIADGFIAPEGREADYHETVIRLPHSYQPNDQKRHIPGYRPTRADCGLPPEGFVFCCFNNNYKITEDIFVIWMRLLHEVPGSILWLLAINPIAADNLYKEAERYGITKERLVFAPKIPLGEHLARLQVADLFLDTLPYNAHTTASEALWMGLPVLTCAGETFAGRVGGSLLTAVGIPELITTSLVAYEAKALRLARDPITLGHLRHTLITTRLTSPLFDCSRYTRNFEAALVHMFETHQMSHPPKSYTVVDQP